MSKEIGSPHNNLFQNILGREDMARDFVRYYMPAEIVGDLDLDFGQVFYLTDTGRRWDGWKVSVRDKMPQQEEWVRQGLVFHRTRDIIRAVEQGKLPDKVMMTVYPQRWDDRLWPWAKELVGQNIKNVVKSFVLQKRTKETKIKGYN